MHHAVVVSAVWRVRHWTMLLRVHLHGRQVWRLPGTHVVSTVLKMEGQLMLMRVLRGGMRRVGCSGRGAVEWLTLKVFLVRKVHS